MEKQCIIAQDDAMKLAERVYVRACVAQRSHAKKLPVTRYRTTCTAVTYTHIYIPQQQQTRLNFCSLC